MKSINYRIWILTAAFTFLGIHTPAMAQAKGYVGLVAGMSIPDADDTSARMAYGLLGGARLDGEWGLGAFYLTSSNKESANGSDFDFDYSIYGIEGSFHFEGVADGAYLGARLGFAKVDAPTTIAGTSTTYSPMAWGVHFGYDFFFSERASVGVEAGYMSIAKDDKTVNSTAQSLKSFGIMNIMASAKFWF